jgi:hypothetical protein
MVKLAADSERPSSLHMALSISARWLVIHRCSEMNCLWRYLRSFVLPSATVEKIVCISLEAIVGGAAQQLHRCGQAGAIHGGMFLGGVPSGVREGPAIETSLSAHHLNHTADDKWGSFCCSAGWPGIPNMPPRPAFRLLRLLFLEPVGSIDRTSWAFVCVAVRYVLGLW